MTNYDNKTGFDSMFFSTQMGRYLSKIRNEKDITLQELSKKMGEKSHTRVTSALNGSKKESDVFFARIAEALGLSPKEYEKLVIQAKQAEMEHSHGNTIHNPEQDPDIAYATLARNYGVSPEDVKKAMELYKAYKN